MTAAGNKVLGISMERQMTRRKLVCGVYAVLAAVCGASIVFAQTEPFLYSWAIYATMMVAFFVFGGSGRYGLIKPFPNKAPRPEAGMVEVIRLQLAPMTAGTPDDASWRNDERELSRRDRAHYLAFQVIGIAVMLLLVVATFGLRSAMGLRHAEWLTVRLALNVMYAIALVGSMLVVTLPAAIILWTEPDMDLGSSGCGCGRCMVIDETKFLGMPLRTQRQRRLLVVGYYAMLLGFAVVGLWMNKKNWGPLVAQTFVVGGLLGGIRIGGPVKAYEEPILPLGMEGPVQTLNISGRKPFDAAWMSLDERERTQRDVAHYKAYRILRVSFALFVLGYFVVMGWAAAWIAEKTLILLWVLLMYVLSLPQSVVLWTEPQAPVGELASVRGGRR